MCVWGLRIYRVIGIVGGIGTCQWLAVRLRGFKRAYVYQGGVIPYFDTRDTCAGQLTVHHQFFFFSCCGVGEEGMHRAIVMTVKWTSARIALLGTVHCGLQVRLVS